MAYKYGVELKGEPIAFNAVVFATAQEADDAGRELLSRWFAPVGYEVVETDDPVNYSFIDGRPERIEA
jgi:hypothetical protein